MAIDPKTLRPKTTIAGDGPDVDPPVQLKAENGDYLLDEAGNYLTTE